LLLVNAVGQSLPTGYGLEVLWVEVFINNKQAVRVGLNLMIDEWFKVSH
jgi:hypothetical protein